MFTSVPPPLGPRALMVVLHAPSTYIVDLLVFARETGSSEPLVLEMSPATLDILHPRVPWRVATDNSGNRAGQAVSGAA